MISTVSAVKAKVGLWTFTTEKQLTDALREAWETGTECEKSLFCLFLSDLDIMASDF